MSDMDGFPVNAFTVEMLIQADSVESTGQGAYLGDFKIMMIVCLSALPLMLLLRKPMPRPSGASR